MPVGGDEMSPIPDGQVVHLRIPLALHARLESAAEEDGLSRTAIIVAALSAWLDRRRPPTMEEEIARVRERFGYTGDRRATCPRGLDDCGTFSTEACRGCER